MFIPLITALLRRISSLSLMSNRKSPSVTSLLSAGLHRAIPSFEDINSGTNSFFNSPISFSLTSAIIV